MSHETSDSESEGAKVYKALLTELEREMKGDTEAPLEDILVAEAYGKRYCTALALATPNFWGRLAAGEFPVDARWKTDPADGRQILAYARIKDLDGSTLFECDFEAIERIEAEKSALARDAEEKIN